MSDPQPNPMDQMDLTEVYAASSAMGAERIVLLLQDDGVDASLRESSVTGFPTVSTARHLIIVPSPEAERARSLIRTAIEDEVLPGEGTFL